MNGNDRDKVEWRLWLKKKRQEIFDLHGSQRSEIIIKRVLDLCRKADFRCIMCYISFGSEVDTRELVEELWQLKKTVCVPQCLPHGQMKAVSISCWEDLSPGKYGILEPHDHLLTIPPDEIDLCLVPGLGFCEDGGRIGSGAGFYDRFLTKRWI
jgi:5-formyltetrahydrofolate cyclo-ligase